MSTYVAARLKSPAVRNVLSEAPSKAPLVNRFLLSLQMKESRKKHASLNWRHQIRGIKSHRPLIVKVKPYDINLKSFEHVLNELNDEISVNLCNRLETNWQKDVEERLETHLFKGKEVKIHKVSTYHYPCSIRPIHAGTLVVSSF